jgi:murein peptide amidase A
MPFAFSAWIPVRPGAGRRMLAVALALLTGPATLAVVTASASPAAASKDTVIGQKVIGTSVQGRKIRAYRLGEAGAPRMVLFAAMHGNEAKPSQILRSLVNGPEVHGIDLWVVPTYNPDGVAAGTRKNAHGVDLNRNFPYRWKNLDGTYESGPKPASEPETRAVMKFLRTVRPRRILSFHQPLNGVDTDTKLPKFARLVAKALRLPAKTFNCGGVCHGTMTMWYNHKFSGAALTVEYGAKPSRRRLRVQAPRQVIRVLGGWRGDVVVEPVP